MGEAKKLEKVLHDALLKRATGYEYEEREIVAGRDGSPERVKIIKRHMPPDVKAITKIQALREMGQWEE